MIFSGTSPTAACSPFCSTPSSRHGPTFPGSPRRPASVDPEKVLLGGRRVRRGRARCFDQKPQLHDPRLNHQLQGQEHQHHPQVPDQKQAVLHVLQQVREVQQKGEGNVSIHPRPGKGCGLPEVRNFSLFEVSLVSSRNSLILQQLI